MESKSARAGPTTASTNTTPRGRSPSGTAATARRLPPTPPNTTSRSGGGAGGATPRRLSPRLSPIAATASPSQPPLRRSPSSSRASPRGTTPLASPRGPMIPPLTCATGTGAGSALHRLLASLSVGGADKKALSPLPPRDGMSTCVPVIMDHALLAAPTGDAQRRLSSARLDGGDVVIYETLDVNDVWLWRAGRFIDFPFPDNNRVCRLAPLCPPAVRQPTMVPGADISPKKGHGTAAVDEATEELRRAVAALKEHQQGASEANEGARNANERLAALRAELAADDVREVAELLSRARSHVDQYITYENLAEMRSYPTPPPIVMRVLEAVKIILEDTVPAAMLSRGARDPAPSKNAGPPPKADQDKATEAKKWKEIKQFVARKDFASLVRDFDAAVDPTDTVAVPNDQGPVDIAAQVPPSTSAASGGAGGISTATLAFLRTECIHRAEANCFLLSAAERASSAAGPLFEWVIAQIRCAELAIRLRPAMAELARVEEAAAGHDAAVRAHAEGMGPLRRRVEDATRALQVATFGFHFLLGRDEPSGSGASVGADGSPITAAIRATRPLAADLFTWPSQPNASLCILVSSIFVKYEKRAPL